MRNTRIATALAIAALGAALMLGGCTTVAGSGPAPDTVTAIGAGTGQAVPDTAQISLGAAFTAKDQAGAQDGASKVSAAIIAAVKAAGIDAKDIQTSQISLNPHYDEKVRGTNGYEAFQSIEVKTKLLDKVAAVIDAATAAGATNISGPQFTLSDENMARVEAIDKAMADAKVRAEAIANAAGRTLGRVISVTEADVTQPGPLYEMSADAAKASGVPIELGQTETKTQLTVVFAIE